MIDNNDTARLSSSSRWPIGLVLLMSVGIGVLVVQLLYHDLVLVLTVTIGGLAGIILLWLFRNSVEFSLFFAVAPFALMHWREILQTQVSLGGMPINLADAVVVTYCLIQGVAAFDRGKRNTRPVPLQWFVLLALSVLGVGLGFVFENRTYDIIRNMRVVLYLIFAFLTTYSLIRTKTQVRQAFKVLLVLGILAAFTVWRTGLQGVNRSVEFIHMGGVSVASVVAVVGTTTPLYVSAYLVVLCHLLLSRRLSKLAALLDAILLIFFLATILFSAIRTSWIVVGLTTLYILFASKRLKPGLVLAILLGLLAGVWLTVQIIGTATGWDEQRILSDRLDVTQSFSGRLEDAHQALIAVNERRGWLFGNGLGATTAFSEAGLEESIGVGDWTGVHNSYVWYYLNLGLAGLVCVLVIIGRVLCLTFVGLRLSQKSDWEWMALAANALAIALAVDGLTAGTFSILAGCILVTGIIWAVASRLGELIAAPGVSSVHTLPCRE